MYCKVQYLISMLPVSFGVEVSILLADITAGELDTEGGLACDRGEDCIVLLLLVEVV